MEGSAARYNTGKLRWDLVDWDGLEEMVKVLEKGAIKYTKSCIFNSTNLLNQCHSVKIIQIEKLSPKDFVDHVMTDNLKLLIRNIGRDKLRTAVLGHMIIPKREKKELEREKEATPPSNEQQGLLQNENVKLLDTVFSTNTISNSLKEAVKSVAQWNGYILTIATQQGSLEEFYVVSATTDLDCLTTIFNVLQERQIISEDTLISNDQLVITGKDNWKKGLHREEILESIQRHLIALFKKEEEDPDPLIAAHHMGNIMCNAMFYLYHYRNKSFSEERNNPFKK